MGIDNSKSIDLLLLLVQIFVKFIALKINVTIILNKSLSKDFYAMLLTFNRIRYDYFFIDIMGLNFFNDKFSINQRFKSNGAIL